MRPPARRGRCPPDRAVRRIALGWRTAARAAALLIAAAGALTPTGAVAQGVADASSSIRVTRVQVVMVNPSGDVARDRRILDRVRVAIGLFPGQRYARETLDAGVATTRRNPDVAEVRYEAIPDPAGGMQVVASVTQRGPGDGPFLEQQPVFPVLVDGGGHYLRAKVEGLAMYYGNHDAWYGRPDRLLDGNPLLVGSPAGRGTAGWMEGFVHLGLYGITPATDQLSVYAGASAMATVSAGRELFTDRSRSYGALEDFFVGIVSGRLDDNGNRLVWNASVGRQRFALGDGMLIANTAANGDNRGALQSNARWAADFVGLAQLRVNDLRIEAFRVDPDELPRLDTRTIIDGLNIEATIAPGLEAAASYLRVPRSAAGYFLPDGSRQERDGLRVYDLRARWQPATGVGRGWFFSTEVARQQHADFPMRATAYQAEAGYTFGDARWTPTVSYRFARFSGDDPDTARYERWDPLLAGGNGEQWVQGINHYKVVQTSNVESHRMQLRLRPHPKVEIVPQAWIFRAESLLNLGGNPALSFLQDSDYGSELNVTGKLYWSRNVYLHGHVAVTRPGEAVRRALDSTERDWWSTMVFVRYAF